MDEAETKKRRGARAATPARDPILMTRKTPLPPSLQTARRTKQMPLGSWPPLQLGGLDP